jgi:ribonuclease HIII
MESVTLKIDEETLNKMKDFYFDCKVEKNNPYIVFACRTIDNIDITIYQSKHGLKVVFMGEDPLKEASIWNKDASLNEKKEKEEYSWLDINSQIGSDEVGTGDFFGPIVVVASYVSKDILTFLKQLGVNDSKKLTDKKIMEIVPKFIDKVIYSKLTCDPIKYNEMVSKGYNMNSIKAVLHNEALKNVVSKSHDHHCQIYIDQFCEKSTYYRYLEGKYEPLIDNVNFHIKGESYYPSVAVSSLIARYSFLLYFEELNKKYHMTFVKGASSTTDEFALNFKNQYGIEELNKVCKMNFKNYLLLK